MAPLISVVTVCFNSEDSIKKTIESVLKQDYVNYEYLIIDGASTDNTLNIIEKYCDSFKGKLKVVSEKDNGWYDAMNKGITLSTGEFIVFLNSDDYFDDKALKIVSDYIKSNNLDACSIVYGDSTNIYSDSIGQSFFRLIKAPERIDINNKAIMTGMCGIRHQSMFTGRDVFEKVGKFNLQYRLHADWDFMIKSLKANIPYHNVGANLSFYSMYGQSTRSTYEERHRVRKDNGLYRVIDINYFKDRFGLKTIIRKVIGAHKWNELLIFYHKIRYRY